LTFVIRFLLGCVAGPIDGGLFYASKIRLTRQLVRTLRLFAFPISSSDRKRSFHGYYVSRNAVTNAMSDIKGPFGQERTTARQDSRLLISTSPSKSFVAHCLRPTITNPSTTPRIRCPLESHAKVEDWTIHLVSSRTKDTSIRRVSRRWFAPLSVTTRPIFPRVDQYSEFSGNYHHHPKVRTAAHSPTTPCQHARNSDEHE
jgi:hypothetical protein